VNSTQYFKPEDVNLEQYGLYLINFSMDAPFDELTSVTLEFKSGNNSLEGLDSLSNDLKLVDKIHRATHSKSQAVIKHLEELELLLELSNDNNR